MLSGSPSFSMLPKESSQGTRAEMQQGKQHTDISLGGCRRSLVAGDVWSGRKYNKRTEQGLGVWL